MLLKLLKNGQLTNTLCPRLKGEKWMKRIILEYSSIYLVW